MNLCEPQFPTSRPRSPGRGEFIFTHRGPWDVARGGRKLLASADEVLALVARADQQGQSPFREGTWWFVVEDDEAAEGAMLLLLECASTALAGAGIDLIEDTRPVGTSVWAGSRVTLPMPPLWQFGHHTGQLLPSGPAPGPTCGSTLARTVRAFTP